MWAEEVPTVCPLNSAHTSLGAVAAVDRVSVDHINMREVFLPTSVKLAGFGFKFTATKNSTTYGQCALPQDLRFRGGTLITKGNVMGDVAKLEVVDVDNILGYGAGFIVANYFENWNIEEKETGKGREEIVEPTMGDNVPEGLYMRLTYTSVGTENDVAVGMNMRAYRDV